MLCVCVCERCAYVCGRVGVSMSASKCQTNCQLLKYKSHNNLVCVYAIFVGLQCPCSQDRHTHTHTLKRTAICNSTNLRSPRKQHSAVKLFANVLPHKRRRDTFLNVIKFYIYLRICEKLGQNVQSFRFLNIFENLREGEKCIQNLLTIWNFQMYFRISHFQIYFRIFEKRKQNVHKAF